VKVLPYRENYVNQIVERLEARPALPMVASTIFAPAAELLVQIESGGAVAHLHIGEPLSDNIQESSVQTDGGTY
jgi:hypothetical protein